MAGNGLPTRSDFDALARRIEQLEKRSITGVVGAELHPVAGQGTHLVVNSPARTSQGTKADQVIPEYPGPGYFWGKITGSTDLGGNQWSYSFVEVHASPGGIGGAGWIAVTSGIAGTAYNLAEASNGASGIQGNGVDITNLAANFPGFALMPAPANAIVPVYEVNTGAGTEYWFKHANAIDGVCE